MLNTLWLCGLAMLLGSVASNANYAGKKQAIINAGGTSDIQGALLRTARPEPDLDADLKNLQTMPDSETKRTDADPEISMSLIAKGSSSPNIDGDLKKLMDASDKATADTKASDNASISDDLDMKNLMASLSKSANEKSSDPGSLASLDSPGKDASKTSDDDPEMDKAMAGMDAELKQIDTPENSSTVEDQGPMKFQALDKVLGDLKTEEQENGDLSKSVKQLGDAGDKDNVDNDKSMKQMDAALASLGNSKDLEQSLADLDQIDQNSSLPNAASLLELEVDEGTNQRMSKILHRMGQMGGHIKHLTQRIEGLHRLHGQVQNGASLLQLSKDDKEDLRSKEHLDQSEIQKELAHVAKIFASSPHSLAQEGSAVSAKTRAEDQAWLDAQLGNEPIDVKQDDKLMKELLAKYQAKYGPVEKHGNHLDSLLQELKA